MAYHLHCVVARANAASSMQRDSAEPLQKGLLHPFGCDGPGLAHLHTSTIADDMCAESESVSRRTKRTVNQSGACLTSGCREQHWMHTLCSMLATQSPSITMAIA